MTSCIYVNGVKICTGPPGNNPNITPPPPSEILVKVPSGATFAIHAPLESAVQQKDGPTPIKTQQELIDLSNHGIPDDKIFWLETYHLYRNIGTAVELIPDMACRMKALESTDIDEKLDAISKAMLQLKDMVADLYDAADSELFPQSSSAETANSTGEVV